MRESEATEAISKTETTPNALIDDVESATPTISKMESVESTPTNENSAIVETPTPIQKGVLEKTRKGTIESFSVAENEANDIKQNFAKRGVEFREKKPLVHEVRENEVEHALKNHGDEATEAQRGNVAITRDEILENYPKITQDYDLREFTDNKTIIYTKQINGHFITIEEALTGQDKLIFKTAWKTKGVLNKEVLLKNAKATPNPRTSNADEVASVERRQSQNPAGDTHNNTLADEIITQNSKTAESSVESTPTPKVETPAETPSQTQMPQQTISRLSKDEQAIRQQIIDFINLPQKQQTKARFSHILKKANDEQEQNIIKSLVYLLDDRTLRELKYADYTPKSFAEKLEGQIEYIDDRETKRMLKNSNDLEIDLLKKQQKLLKASENVEALSFEELKKLDWEFSKLNGKAYDEGMRLEHRKVYDELVKKRDEYYANLPTESFISKTQEKYLANKTQEFKEFAQTLRDNLNFYYLDDLNAGLNYLKQLFNDAPNGAYKAFIKRIEVEYKKVAKSVESAPTPKVETPAQTTAESAPKAAESAEKQAEQELVDNAWKRLRKELEAGDDMTEAARDMAVWKASRELIESSPNYKMLDENTQDKIYQNAKERLETLADEFRVARAKANFEALPTEIEIKGVKYKKPNADDIPAHFNDARKAELEKTLKDILDFTGGKQGWLFDRLVKHWEYIMNLEGHLQKRLDIVPTLKQKLKDDIRERFEAYANHGFTQAERERFNLKRDAKHRTTKAGLARLKADLDKDGEIINYIVDRNYKDYVGEINEEIEKYGVKLDAPTPKVDSTPTDIAPAESAMMESAPKIETPTQSAPKTIEIDGKEYEIPNAQNIPAHFNQARREKLEWIAQDFENFHTRIENNTANEQTYFLRDRDIKEWNYYMNLERELQKQLENMPTLRQNILEWWKNKPLDLCGLLVGKVDRGEVPPSFRLKTRDDHPRLTDASIARVKADVKKEGEITTYMLDTALAERIKDIYADAEKYGVKLDAPAPKVESTPKETPPSIENATLKTTDYKPYALSDDEFIAIGFDPQSSMAYDMRHLVTQYRKATTKETKDNLKASFNYYLNLRDNFPYYISQVLDETKTKKEMAQQLHEGIAKLDDEQIYRWLKKNNSRTFRVAEYGIDLNDKSNAVAKTKAAFKNETELFGDFIDNKYLEYAEALIDYKRFGNFPNPFKTDKEWLDFSKKHGFIYDKNKPTKQSVKSYQQIKAESAPKSNNDVLYKMRSDGVTQGENPIYYKKVAQAVDELVQKDEFRNLSRDKQDAILHLGRVSPAPMPEGIKIKDLEHLSKHYEGKIDEAQRNEFLKLYNDTKNTPDVVLEVFEKGENRQEYIKVFAHEENKDMSYIIVAKDETDISAYPITRPNQVLKDIKEAISARNFGEISYLAAPIKSPTLKQNLTTNLFNLANNRQRVELRNAFYRGADSASKEIYRKVESAIKDSGVRVEFADDLGKTLAMGEYHADKNLIKIKKGMDEGETSNTILHEMIHAATAHAIKNPANLTPKQRHAIGKLQKIYAEAKAANTDARLDYAFKNLDEFVAELSNPALNQSLKSGGFFERIIDAIAQFFGIAGISKDSQARKALYDLLDTTPKGKSDGALYKMGDVFSNVKKSLDLMIKKPPTF